MARETRYNLNGSILSPTKTGDGAGGFYLEYSTVVAVWRFMEATMTAQSREAVIAEHGLEQDIGVRRFVGTYNELILKTCVLLFDGEMYRILSTRHPCSFGDPAYSEIVVVKLKT